MTHIARSGPCGLTRASKSRPPNWKRASVGAREAIALRTSRVTRSATLGGHTAAMLRPETSSVGLNSATAVPPP